MKEQKEKKQLNYRNKKRDVILLGVAAFVIWLVLLIFKILYTHSLGETFDFVNLLNSIWDNILGILPPLILIDLVFEFVTQRYVSEEMSEQITSTLMSNPETIDQFGEETKRNFLNATIGSLVKNGDSEAEMARNSVKPYISGGHNLKKYFTYNITLRDEAVSPLFNSKDYFSINEKLGFEKHFLATEPLGELFSVGFFTSNSELDKNLRGQSFLFREGLTIRQEELDALINMTAEEKMNFVVHDMSLMVYIGHERCEINRVMITQIGIQVEFRAAQPIGDTAYFEIAFCMPRLTSEKIFLAAVTEPTYSVNIRFDYPRSIYKVEMYPFFNDVEDARVEDANWGVGVCDINLRDKWVYPMSGVVFRIEEKV